MIYLLVFDILYYYLLSPPQARRADHAGVAAEGGHANDRFGQQVGLDEWKQIVPRFRDTARQYNTFGHEDFNKAVEPETELFAVYAKNLVCDGATVFRRLENRFAV